MSVHAEFSAERKRMQADGLLTDLRDLVLRIESYGSDIAVVEKKEEQKIIYTYEKLCSDVQALATALFSLGLQNCHIALLAENSYRWIVSFLAVVSCGGVAVPLDKELTECDFDSLLARSESVALFCSATFSETSLRNKDTNGFLQHVFCFDAESDGMFAWDQLLAIGKDLLNHGDRRFSGMHIDPAQVAAMLFTSGTTGANKGVLLTHKNLVSNINTIAETAQVKDVTMSILPMNHIYELNCNILPMLYMHTVICINDRMRNLMHNFRFFKPQMAVVVPLFLEEFYNKICRKIRVDGLDQKFERSIVMSNRLLDAGIDIRRVVFKRVHEYFGGELSLFICGGAPVDAKYVKGLTELGFDIIVGYGLTEASPIAALNMNTRQYPDSVGKPFANTAIHIHAPNEDGEGEVWLRGDNIISAYYKDTAATLESFEDGWFKTGDIGKMTVDGYLLLTGRKKNLIILDNGKNVHPEEIEAVIREQLPYVREVVVMETEKEIFGVFQKIIAAVLYIDPSDFPELTEQQTEQMAKEDVAKVNALLPGYKTVSHVLVARHSFQKTSTNKILRKKVIEQYGENCRNEKTGGNADA